MTGKGSMSVMYLMSVTTVTEADVSNMADCRTTTRRIERLNRQVNLFSELEWASNDVQCDQCWRAGILCRRSFISLSSSSRSLSPVQRLYRHAAASLSTRRNCPVASYSFACIRIVTVTAAHSGRRCSTVIASIAFRLMCDSVTANNKVNPRESLLSAASHPAVSDYVLSCVSVSVLSFSITKISQQLIYSFLQSLQGGPKLAPFL